MNTILLSILLQLAAGVIVFAEIFIPSGGILAIIAMGLFGYSLFLLFSGVSITAGSLTLGLDLIIVPIIFLWGFKRLGQSKVALQTQLSKDQGVVSQSKDMDALVGLKGIAISSLRPSGCAEINDLRVDVVSQGEYIENGTRIEVVAATGNQVIVSAYDSEQS